jgi:hypothetical protein
MSTIINATTTNGVVIQPDNSGSLQLATNSGTTAVTIDTSQNVGIGTTSPSYKLHIEKSGDANIFCKSTTGTNGAGIFILSGSDNSIYSAFNAIKSSNNDGTQQWYIGGNGGVNTLTFQTSTTERMRIDSTGGLILAGSTAQKATGTTWSNPSDQRLKENIRDYTKGTNELMQVRVREWEYNGKGNTTEGMKGLGVVADEVMTVLPDTVETYNAKLNADDEEDAAIKKFDATEITWLLVKTVQEQQTIINDLKARVETLEAK